MTKINKETDTKESLDSLVDALPFSEQIPRRSGEVAFNQAWEIRAFSITTALHAQGRFEWKDFQARLIKSIKEWEASNTDSRDWSYYERWMMALEELMQEKGMVAGSELESRTQEVLAVPPNNNHHHAVREPIAVSAPVASSERGEAHGRDQ
jgi:nitrile hydratase accessory protein